VALRLALADRDAAWALGLDQASRVLLFNTEGATDLAMYTAVIGGGSA